MNIDEYCWISVEWIIISGLDCQLLMEFRLDLLEDCRIQASGAKVGSSSSRVKLPFRCHKSAEKSQFFVILVYQ